VEIEAEADIFEDHSQSPQFYSNIEWQASAFGETLKLTLLTTSVQTILAR